ncbi:GNAT family N-acetyltransferase [Evtepia sp.]
MFFVRPYREEDAAACGDCLYEGFFSCPVEGKDWILLRDYAQVLIEKCNFTYVAETEDHQVVGFICGKYAKTFRKALAGRYETPKHYGLWCKMFLKFYLKRYKMSAPFQKEFDAFFRQLRERDQETFGACDLELVALASKRNYRKGLGTALVSQFLDRGKGDGAACVRLFTNTLASWEFYEKRGFQKVAEKPFRDGSGARSIVYEYDLTSAAEKQGGAETRHPAGNLP